MGNRAVKFLLVDDLEGNLLALEGLLRREGLELLKARTGTEALELLLVHEVALAILDVQMPDMNGFELAELMRGAERTRRVPIIFVTAGALDKQRHFRGYELGAVDFLFKPIDPHILRSKAGVFFELALQRHELQAALEENARLLEERVEAERQARESEAHTRRVLNNLFAFVGLTKIDGTLLEANRAPLDAAGIPASEVIGKKFWDCFWWNYCPDVQAQLREAMRRASEGEVVRYDVQVRMAGDSRMWIDFQVAPLRDSQGRITHLLPSAMDITARKQFEAALHQAQDELQKHAENLERTVEERTARLRETVAELEAFSYSIAHDMRSPLRSLKGFSDLLVEEYANRLDDTGRAYLQRISSSAARMDKLILDVLNYSKVVRGEASVAPVNVPRLLNEIIETYPVFRERGAEIQIVPPIPPVLGNEAMLTQVFSNLLGNAMKFVAPGVSPKVRVWAEARDGRVRVFIHDNGIGIALDQHQKIFGMFQRVDKSFEGTGIGLAIVEKAMQRMGGTVGVESEPGKGSTFWIDFAAAA